MLASAMMLAVRKRRHIDESAAMARKRPVTEPEDMSTDLLTSPRAKSCSATARRRAVTACGDMSTTAHLLQALHIDQILGPAGGQLE